MMRTLVLVAVLLSIAPAARADWEYTHWGMTPQQVVAGSHGTMKLLSAKEEARLPPNVTAVSGTYKDGALELRVSFMFTIATNGLTCVNYGVNRHQDDEAFNAALIKRYGPPKKTGPFFGVTTLSWTTPTDKIDASFSEDDRAWAMQCSLKK